MKVVILAGGLGTRLSEETHSRPKPMVEVGGYPILWHILKLYSFYGLNDFIICCGYKGYMIKEYFVNYFHHTSDLTIDLSDNSIEIHKKKSDNWKVSLIDTGSTTLTGGRLAKVREYVGDKTFCFTYGDGLADIDINKLISFHKNEGRLATLTAVQPPGRFGSLSFDRGRVLSFEEKPKGDNTWINGGFFVLEPSAIDYVDGELCSWEERPMKNLAKDEQLSAYHHSGFWQPMDTLRDKMLLEDLWYKNKAPWKTWK